MAMLGSTAGIDVETLAEVQVSGETPQATGDPRVFETEFEYVPGTLEVVGRGLRRERDFDFTEGPGPNQYTLDYEPDPGFRQQVNYLRADYL